MLNYKVYNYILNSKKLSKVCINQFKQGNAVTDHIKLYLMRCVIYHSVFHIVLILHLCDSFVPYFYGNKFHSKKKKIFILAIVVSDVILGRFTWVSVKRDWRKGALDQF